MNFFGRPSRKPSTANKPSVDKKNKGNGSADLLSTLEQIRSKVELIEKREAFQNTKAEFQAKEAMIKLKAGDKRGALQCLKRKKQFERDAEKLMLMKSNLEDLILSIETSHVTLAVQHGLEAGLAAQRRLGLDPDKIAELQADVEAELVRIEEASSAASQPLFVSTATDSEILDDLHELEKEIRLDDPGYRMSSLSMVSRVSAAPSVSSSVMKENITPPPLVVKEEEEEEMVVGEEEEQEVEAPLSLPLLLPIAPTHAVNVYQQEEEEDLQRLEMDMY